MRPTTKDVAVMAGVSLATVDRVLNGRSGVRPETVTAVHDAAKKLGFVRNLQAANLARQKVYRFLFLLPATKGAFLETITKAIEEARAVFFDSSILIETRHALSADPLATTELLGQIKPEEADGVAIMAPLTPQVRDAKRRLAERGITVVQFASGQPDQLPYSFAGIDNAAAGRTVARLMGRFIGATRGRLMVITETLKSLDSAERRRGFDEIMTRDYPDLDVLATFETHGDPARLRRILAQACSHSPDILGVYVMSAEAGPILAEVNARPELQNKTVIAHELTPVTEKLLLDGKIDALIAQDPGHLVRSAIRILRARNDGTPLVASQEVIRIEILLRENLTR